MGKITGIQWCDHTFSTHWVCTPVSAGCDNCYAESLNKRLGTGQWGPGAPRKTFGDAYWLRLLQWNKAAIKAGERHRVFCNSMSDLFDAEAPTDVLDRFWAYTKLCPDLDFLCLTKRHGRIARSLPADWGNGYPNVWLGVSAENQPWADARLKALRQIPHIAPTFVSYEPALEDVDFQLEQEHSPDWVIIGGESGPKARPFDPAWAAHLIEQCHAAGVAPFVKQMGSVWARAHQAKDGHGGDMSEWPEALRVREFPR